MCSSLYSSKIIVILLANKMLMKLSPEWFTWQNILHFLALCWVPVECDVWDIFCLFQPNPFYKIVFKNNNNITNSEFLQLLQFFTHEENRFNQFVYCDETLMKYCIIARITFFEEQDWIGIGKRAQLKCSRSFVLATFWKILEKVIYFW
jgi:hypothetical protein